MSNNTRRQFMKQIAMIASIFPFVGVLGRISSAEAKEKKPSSKEKSVPLPEGHTAVSESDPVASAIGFKHHVKDIDYSKYPQRKKPDAKNQFCKSCALYTSVNEGWGKCQMLTSGLVSAEGWCGSWSKKS